MTEIKINTFPNQDFDEIMTWLFQHDLQMYGSIGATLIEVRDGLMKTHVCTDECRAKNDTQAA